MRAVDNEKVKCCNPEKDCTNEVPLWYNLLHGGSGYCLDCLSPCPDCGEGIPEWVLSIHGGRCMNCAAVKYDQDHPCELCGCLVADCDCKPEDLE